MLPFFKNSSPSKKISEINKKLFEFILDFKVTDESFIIDEESIKMLEQGVIGQRFIYIDYIDKDTQKIYRYYTPTVLRKEKVETFDDVQNRRETEKLIKEAKYPLDQVAEAPAHGLRGVVHRNGDNINKRNHKKTLYTTHFHLNTEFLSAGSCKKDKDGLMFLGNSVFNETSFRLQEFFYVVFHYYLQCNLQREETISYVKDIMRRTPWDYLYAGMSATSKKTGEPITSKMLRSAENMCKPDELEKTGPWVDFLKLSDIEKKYFICRELMKTIYFAASIQDDLQNPASMLTLANDENLVRQAIKLAKEYKVDLNLNFIPKIMGTASDTTAIMHAAFNGKYNIVKTLIEEKVNLHHKDKKGYSLLDYALLGGNDKIINLLVLEKKLSPEHDLNLHILDTIPSEEKQINLLQDLLRRFTKEIIFSIPHPIYKSPLLHCAIAQSKLDLIAFIIQKDPGAISRKNAGGITALDIALRNKAALQVLLPYLNEEEQAKVLESSDADDNIKAELHKKTVKKLS